LAIDQDKGDTAVFSRSIGPTVIGSALNHNITREDGGFTLVH
jgi:hypothetical protein